MEVHKQNQSRRKTPLQQPKQGTGTTKNKEERGRRGARTWAVGIYMVKA
jgi:hypothetical protein